MAKTYNEGTYEGEVISVEQGFSSIKRTPQIVLGVKFDSLDGAVLYKYLYTSDAALEWTLKGLEALGYEEDDFENVKNVIGKRANFVFKNKPDEDGHPRTEIAFINKIGGGGVPMAAGERAAFNANMREKIRALKAKKEADAALPEEEFNV